VDGSWILTDKLEYNLVQKHKAIVKNKGQKIEKTEEIVKTGNGYRDFYKEIDS
jgi:hypothetical protein